MKLSIPDYDPIALRGSGAFGYVMEAYDIAKDIRVAIKRTHKVGPKLSREYEVISKLSDCENIVKLLDIFYTISEDGKIIQNLVFEFVNDSLDGYIESYKNKKKFIPIDKIKEITRQFLNGLSYIHSKGIVHRDLKPENILMTEDEKVKICDFGSSKILSEDKINSPYNVSRYYRAPELILGFEKYNEKIDIFSAGCIIAQLFLLNPLFPGKSDGLQFFEYISVLGNPGKEYFKQFNLIPFIQNYFLNFEPTAGINLENILNTDGNYNSNDIKEASDLILKMICWNYNDRLSAEECLKHPFLKK